MTIANNTIYTSTEVTVKGNIFSITVAVGKYNYVSVLKKTNNPYGGLGKQFANFDEATRAYKSPEMKTALLKVELGIGDSLKNKYEKDHSCK